MEHVTRHLFSFPMSESGRKLCSYTDSELKYKYRHAPCNQMVAQAFDLQGVPVLTDLSVTVREEGDNPDDSMIAGTLTIRVVPAPGP